MAKSAVMLAAALMGATAFISPVQAVILSQENTQQVQEEQASSLIARRDRFRRQKRYCWRRYGRLYCRDRYESDRDYRWRRQRWEDRRKWEKERERRWKERRRRLERRRRWENRRRRREEDYWRSRRRDRDYENENWRKGDRRGDFQDKLDRWLNRGRDDDD
ncbi:hypothetical protein [Acaryochloris marina]|uniref:Uncharacterized protein n=1 Tax=Acaryochloris marina (strain MBIC 11017) TaxID=329726 RepID=B0C092_ACAM1|nr:hypothetical protein [Acaryochloris marina]ABW29584.1 hypothetical protein AM1_4610 [Acaryochloris marina MBIC11017]BDM78488.1 hypothetical protein AM10699_13570 [Acaryochloris marina MBIC10699]